MSATHTAASDGLLQGECVAFLGKLGAVSKRAAQQLVKQHGGTAVEADDERLNVVVIGADESPQRVETELLSEDLRRAADAGRVRVISETEFWRRLGVIEAAATDEDRLYTPAMLAELLDVPLAVVRRWSRRRLIVPTHTVHGLPYFSFQEIAAARTLAQLHAAGASLDAIEKKLAKLTSRLPEVQRPLAQLSVTIDGKQLLLRDGEVLLEPGGQFRFDFAALEANQKQPDQDTPSTLQIGQPLDVEAIETPEELCHLAMRMEDEGRLSDAVDMYRASLAAGGPCPETNFQLAELLYRIGDLSAARERYYMVVELDEQFVEARHNLGCLLAEMGETDLAVAAFEGALSIYPDYADAHFHLAQTLDRLAAENADAAGQAVIHWRRFLDLAPDSPWADEARDQLT